MNRKTGVYTVITGSSFGIGLEAAKAFADRGKNLIIAARSTDRLEALKSDILKNHPCLDVVIRTVDLSVPENVYRFYESLSGYALETFINNAGFGHYGSVAEQDLGKIGAMLRLNIEALKILSTLFVHDYRDAEGAQLINISSCGGYTLVPDAVSYCASKFYVSAFTEGLALELSAAGARLRAKVLAPAATKTEFGKRANDVSEYDYDSRFALYHTAKQMAGFLMELYDSDSVAGAVDRNTFEFSLSGPRLPYAGDSKYNQRDA